MTTDYHVIGIVDSVRSDLSGWLVRIDDSPAYFTVQAADWPASLDHLLDNKLLVIHLATGQLDVIAANGKS